MQEENQQEENQQEEKPTNRVVQKAVQQAKVVAMYKAHLLISDFIESRPQLAPTPAVVKSRKGAPVTSETNAWGWNQPTNQWEPPSYSESKDACQLFLAKFDEMGLLVTYVQYVVNRIASVLVSEKEGDDELERANKLCYNMGKLLSVNSDVLVTSAFQMITKIIEDQGETVDGRLKIGEGSSGVIVN